MSRRVAVGGKVNPPEGGGVAAKASLNRAYRAVSSRLAVVSVSADCWWLGTHGLYSRRQQTRNRASYPWTGRGSASAVLRPEPVGAAIPWDELWVVVKCLSSPEIAGSPRNAFKCSLGCSIVGVEPPDGIGPTPRHPTQPNSESRNRSPGVGPRELIPWSRGEQPRPPAKVPKRGLSVIS